MQAHHILVAIRIWDSLKIGLSPPEPHDFSTTEVMYHSHLKARSLLWWHFQGAVFEELVLGVLWMHSLDVLQRPVLQSYSCILGWEKHLTAHINTVQSKQSKMPSAREFEKEKIKYLQNLETCTCMVNEKFSFRWLFGGICFKPAYILFRIATSLLRVLLLLSEFICSSVY